MLLSCMSVVVFVLEWSVCHGKFDKFYVEKSEKIVAVGCSFLITHQLLVQAVIMSKARCFWCVASSEHQVFSKERSLDSFWELCYEVVGEGYE